MRRFRRHNLTPSVLALALAGCASAWTTTHSSIPRPVPEQPETQSQATLSRPEAAATLAKNSSSDVGTGASKSSNDSLPGPLTDQRARSRNDPLELLSGIGDAPDRFDEDAGVAPDGGRPTLSERLKMPAELPGADAAPLSLPQSNEAGQRDDAISAMFPNLPALTTEFRIEGAADQLQLTLADLERLALDSNPAIAQASADIGAAEGAAIQAGAYPNPTVGYEADTVGSAGTRNYQGMYFQQEIMTAGKLDLARSIANVDLMNRQLDLRQARADLLRKVRANYFAVQVARENLRYSEALVRFTNEVYRVQVEQLRGGQTAAYEPMQLRALAVMARGAFAQARNRYVSAWKQLAAALGTPDLPATALVGRVDLSYRPIDYEAATSFMLTNNSEMLVARNLEFQKRLNLRLAEVTPIPNINLYSAIQKDFTSPPIGRTTYNVQFGVPVPIFNRNVGGIQQARGELIRAGNEVNRVRLDLTAQLADAFERYEDNRILLEYYRDHILPDQVRVYRGVYERHQQESEKVVFGDIIVAQQQLQQSIAAYIQAMNGQWTAYADIALLLQLEDLSRLPLADQPAVAEPAPLLPEPTAVPPVELPPPAKDAESGEP